MSKREYQKLLKEKAEVKKELFERCYPGENLKHPLIVLFAPEKKGAREIMFNLLEGMMVLPGRVIVVSDDQPEDVVKRPTGKITWVSPEKGRAGEIIEKYLTASDMAIVFEEHLSEMRELLKRGVVVVGPDKSPLLETYHPNEETGYSFTYNEMNPWDIFRALVRAHETFAFPFDWGNIVRAMLKVKL